MRRARRSGRSSRSAKVPSPHSRRLRWRCTDRRIIQRRQGAHSTQDGMATGPGHGDGRAGACGSGCAGTGAQVPGQRRELPVPGRWHRRSAGARRVAGPHPDGRVRGPPPRHRTGAGAGGSRRTAAICDLAHAGGLRGWNLREEERWLAGHDGLLARQAGGGQWTPAAEARHGGAGAVPLACGPDVARGRSQTHVALFVGTAWRAPDAQAAFRQAFWEQPTPAP